MKIREGFMPFAGGRTWYRIAGEADGQHAPLILLHGGPGSCHDYFELLDPLAESGREIISYDQIGCGNSWLDHHPELWTFQTWQEELHCLIRHLGLQEYHLLGQSWGGMLAIGDMIESHPQGLLSAILSSTLPASSLWASEQHRLIGYLSEEDQEAIRTAEETGDYSAPAYLRANDHFMKRHCADVRDSDPECLRRRKKTGTEAYLTAWGPNEYTPTGTLKDFDYVSRLCEIDVPCLIMSGTDDLCTPLIAKTMYDRIPEAEWELFPGVRHMCFAEATDRYLKRADEWLEKHDRRS